MHTRCILTLLLLALTVAGAIPSASAAEPLVVSLDTDVNTLDTGTLRSIAAFTVTQTLYTPLIRQALRFNPSAGIALGTDEWLPALAETFSLEGSSARFVLRRGLKFADGTPITTRDVVYTFRRALEGPGFLRPLAAFIGLDSIDQLSVVDEQTLIMRRVMVQSPLFLRILSFQNFGILSERTGAQHARPDDPWATRWFSANANSSGPYILRQYDPQQQVTLVPNPNYYERRRVRNAGVTIRFVPDNTQRALLLQRGQLDVATGISPRLLSALQSDSSVRIYAVPSTRLMYLGMNNIQAPFTRREVRQAVSYAVPYDALLQRVMLGFASRADNLVTTRMRTHAGVGRYTTDLARARELLSRAGVGSFSVQLAVRQSRNQEREAAIFIQDSLRQVGINVEILTLPDGEFFNRLNRKELALFIHDWYQWGEDPFQLMWFLVKSDSFTNYTQYRNPTLDELIVRGLHEPNPSRRAEISREAQRILFEDAPMAYLYAPHWIVATRAGVQGVNKDQSEILRLEELYKP